MCAGQECSSLKGEDQYEGGRLDQAVAELKQKMRRWSQSYRGQVRVSLCICHVWDANIAPCKDSVMAQTMQDLVGLSAMKAKVCHKAYPALQVGFLLCYAMAGGHVRICMLCRDDPDSCLVLSVITTSMQ